MNGKAVGKKAEPTGEELVFIYSKFQEKLSDEEVLEEMRDQPFLRRSIGFLKRRRKEFNAAKYVLREYFESNQDELIIDAKRKHIRDINKLIQTWKDQLVFKVAEPLGGYEVVFPMRFTKEDNMGPGKYGPKGNLCWEIRKDKTIRVWFLVEHESGFSYLKEHLTNEQLWKDFNDMKMLLSQEVAEVTETNETALERARNIQELAYNLVIALEEILARGIPPGSCSICKQG